MTAKKIVVIGSSNTDMMVKAPHLPAPGETILGGTFMMNAGGKGANQAVAAARLGGDVAFIAKTGDDLFGRQSVDLYKAEKINTDYIYTDSTNPSGVALITVDQNAENSIVVAPGANGTLMPGDIKSAEEEIKSAGILLMQFEIPMDTVIYAAKIAKNKGVKVIVNPAPAQEIPDELLKNTNIIIPNETEAEIISGVKVTNWDSARLAAKAIYDKGVDIVIITLGSLGSLIKDGDTFHEVHALKVDAVDTTAAGDTFCGALSVALSEGKTLIEAVEFGNKCSAITVTRMGAQSSIPYRKEIV